MVVDLFASWFAWKGGRWHPETAGKAQLRVWGMRTKFFIFESAPICKWASVYHQHLHSSAGGPADTLPIPSSYCYLLPTRRLLMIAGKRQERPSASASLSREAAAWEGFPTERTIYLRRKTGPRVQKETRESGAAAEEGRE